MNMNGMTVMDPDNAFSAAINSGRLSENSTDDNYAGNYMYMGTQTASYRPVRQQRDLFKNINTRQYLD